MGERESEYSPEQLHQAALQAGEKLFGERLTFFPPDEIQVERVGLLELQLIEEEGENYIDEYEFIFFPRRGGGLDASNELWKDARPAWVDDDGFIYTAWAGGIIRVITVNVPLKQSSSDRGPEGSAGAAEAPMCQVDGFRHHSAAEIDTWLHVERCRAVNSNDLARIHYVNSAIEREPDALEAILNGRPDPIKPDGAGRKSFIP